MIPKKRFTLVTRIKSFGFALSGIRLLFQSEPNALLHLMAGLLALVLGWVCEINSYEWLFVIIAIALVFAMELFNTSIEILSDYVQPNKHEAIKKVKDLSAGAVLIVSLGALIGGLIIFIPKLILFL